MRLQLIAAAATVVAVVAAGADARADDEPDVWRVSTDSLVYTDTDNVLIISPQLTVHRTVDDDGGSASARVVVDVVSAASVDVVSQATNRFSEVRTEVDLAFSKAMGVYLPSATYSYSHEADYVSHGLGAGLQRELGSSDTTLSMSYGVSLDTVGYTGTPASVFSESLISQSVVASLTQVLDRKTVVRGVYNLTVQNGYMEKPYRFVPLFDQAGIAAAMADGVTLDLSTFDRYRLPLRPAERVPNQRVSHAIAFRALRYVDWLPGSLRLDYQFFGDSWGVRAHTIEPGVSWKKSKRWTVAAYARFYLQQAASFWQREYVVAAGEVPRWRTMDRDLSDYYTISGGARLEWTRPSMSAYVELGAMETVYSDYLFLTSRLALVSQVGVRLPL